MQTVFSWKNVRWRYLSLAGLLSLGLIFAACEGDSEDPEDPGVPGPEPTEPIGSEDPTATPEPEATEEPTAMPEDVETEEATGVVAEVNAPLGLVDIEVDGEAGTFSMDDNTEILIDGQEGTAEDLAAGDEVAFEFESDSSRIVSLEVTGEGSATPGAGDGEETEMVEATGVVESVDTMLSLIDITVEGESETFAFNDDTEVVMDGEAGSIEDLQEGDEVTFEYGSDSSLISTLEVTGAGSVESEPGTPEGAATPEGTPDGTETPEGTAAPEGTPAPEGNSTPEGTAAPAS